MVLNSTAAVESWFCVQCACSCRLFFFINDLWRAAGLLVNAMINSCVIM